MHARSIITMMMWATLFSKFHTSSSAPVAPMVRAPPRPRPLSPPADYTNFVDGKPHYQPGDRRAALMPLLAYLAIKDSFK